MSGDTVRKKRGFESVADMGRSLGLVAAFVAAILLVGPARSLLFPTHSDRMPAVDYREQVLGARQLVGHDVPSPGSLPSGWRATSARVTGGGGKPVTLHIGFATQSEEYAGVEATTATAAAAYAAVLGTRTPAAAGAVDVNGRPWQRLRAANGDRALTGSLDGLTVVVTGTASEADLETLARSLR